MEPGPREWSPGSENARKRGQVLIKVLGNLGDRRPLDHGGFIVYRIQDPSKVGPHSRWVQAEFWEEPLEVERDDPEKDLYEVYRWQIEPDVFKELSWVDDWDEVAGTVGIDPEELRKLGRSTNPMERAVVYETVGRVHGFENLDSYPERFTRKQMEERWPEFA